MGMDDAQIGDRLHEVISVDDVKNYATSQQKARFSDNADLSRAEKLELSAEVVAQMPYLERVERLKRPEEVSDGDFVNAYLTEVNTALGTHARTLEALVSELGQMRFGRKPKVADTFCGGGSIPFEASRLGCDAYGSDLNPIAWMLSWGAVNIVGANKEDREKIKLAQDEVVMAVEKEISPFETDSKGNRAKAYLYCTEARCPQTKWLVPISSTWVISKKRKIVAKLVPVAKEKRFDIVLQPDASEAEMLRAARGSIKDGVVFYEVDGKEYRTPIKTLRGDYRTPDGVSGNKLRPWEKLDFVARPDDVFRERLYCIQWITKETVDAKRQTTFFQRVRREDLAAEQKVEDLVRANIANWQANGLIPDMPIEPGDETSRLMRERGWTHWHHLFSARQLLLFATTRIFANEQEGIGRSAVLIGLAKALDWGNRNCRFGTGAARESISNLFSNQALNTLSNYGVRSAWGMMDHVKLDFGNPRAVALEGEIASHPASKLNQEFDIFITDPPYADAVNYHEITEFFIAWLRKNPPAPFDCLTWDSRRSLAIKGDGEEFRLNMVDAYRTMTNHMPDNGLQIVMFTHQSSAVWADMAQIFWGAGLQIMAAWYIATETTSELKKGGYRP
ncbi:adenine-specific DNA methylase [Bradyrhizobium sp. RT9a]